MQGVPEGSSSNLPSPEARALFVASAISRSHQATQEEDILSELRKSVEVLGRPPSLREFPLSSQLLQRFGSLQKAVAQIEPHLDAKVIHLAAERRKTELQLDLVRELLRGKNSANFRRLSPDRQADVRAFFSSFEEACQKARELIEESRDPKRIEKACRTSSAGKRLPDALYVHTSALPFLPSVLRALALRASMLANESGQTNIVKQ
jgi:DNA phosphorothioation-associated putative methyltransferase